MDIKAQFERFRNRTRELQQDDPHQSIVPSGTVCLRSRETPDGGVAGRLDIMTYAHAARCLIGWSYPSHDLATETEAQKCMADRLEAQARIKREQEMGQGVQEYFTGAIRTVAERLAREDVVDAADTSKTTRTRRSKAPAEASESESAQATA
jgi:hypothetical protein